MFRTTFYLSAMLQACLPLRRVVRLLRLTKKKKGGGGHYPARIAQNFKISTVDICLCALIRESHFFFISSAVDLKKDIWRIACVCIKVILVMFTAFNRIMVVIINFTIHKKKILKILWILIMQHNHDLLNFEKLINFEQK
jgi:hypothetical protein